MQYLLYIQVTLLALLLIVGIWLLFLSYSIRKKSDEIKTILKESYSKSKKEGEKVEPVDEARPQKNEKGNINGLTELQNDLRFIIVEACMHRKTNKCFLILEEIYPTQTKFIIPTGEIKVLENELFGDFEEYSLEELLKNKLINKQQLISYFNFLSTSSTLPLVVDDHPKNDQEEPTYMKTYRAMLDNPDTWPSKLLETIRSKSPIRFSDLKNEMDSKYEYSSCESNGSFNASLRVLLVDGYINIEGKGNSKIIIAQQNVRAGRQAVRGIL